MDTGYPRYREARIRPFLYITPSIRDSSVTMLVLLGGQLVLLGVAKDFSALLVIFTALLGSGAAFYAGNWNSRERAASIVPDLVQGTLIGMLLPSAYPPVSVFFISFSALLAGKFFTGNTACVRYNRVAIAVIVAWIAGAALFPHWTIPADAYAAPNVSLTLIQEGAVGMVKYDGVITEYLNRTVFHLFNVSVPEGYVSLLWDNGSSIPAFRFNLATVVSSIVLLATGVFTISIPVLFLTTYGVLVRLLLPVFFGGTVGHGDVLLSFLTGGTLFCALYLLQWFGTVPATTGGKCVYAVCGGLIAFFVAGYAISPVGMVFTVLITDMVSAVIQGAEDRLNLRKTKRLLPAYGQQDTAI